ncbi:MAG: SH3 domain-containing protein [Anaerolineae bacterium]|nr:SH3 domain-containing protein [Anaerolineae bacterium]
MRTRFTLWTSLSILFLLMAFISSGLAQEETCEPLLQTAFEQLNANCAALPGSAACFGSGASVTGEGDAGDGFSQPGDQLPLSEILGVQTLPQDEAWGLALLNVHANVPLELSEQGLKFILVGDVQVENAVDPATAFTPVPSIIVTPLVAANLRSAPSTDARVLANAPVGTELTADGVSSDGGWLRVLSGGQLAWISRQIVAEKEGDIESLPTITSNTRTLMQSLRLSTGANVPACSGAPASSLLAQSPAGVNASITVNGVDIRFEGTIALRTTPDNVLQFIVLAGGGSVGGVSVPAGFSLNIPFDPQGGSPGNATGLRPINEEERAALTPIAEGVNPELLYTALDVPSQSEVNAVLAQINGAAGAQVVSGPASNQADCSRFRPTSPLSGMPLGVTPFYWDAAPGATAYRINLFADGSLVSSIEMGATSTTFQVDTNAFGGGGSFSWSIDALVNGQLACSSGRVSVVRDAFAQFVSGGSGGGPQAEPTACSWEGC